MICKTLARIGTGTFPDSEANAKKTFVCSRSPCFNSKVRIAFLGTRGIPRCYSGFETFVEELAVRLVARGHEVTVYNRIPFNPYRESTFRGVRLVHLPTLQWKTTDTILHTALSVLHSLKCSYDLVYICGVGNGLFAGAFRWRNIATVVNVDGADFARAKWSGFGRWWLHRSEKWASHLADGIVADNPVIQQRYRDLYQTEAIYLPYGATPQTQDPGTETLQQIGLESKKFFLYVSRLTPENRADLAVRAYLQSGVPWPLVVVGDAPYQEEYIRQLKALAQTNPNIKMTGYLFGDGYRQLSYHAAAFLMPSAIDATRPVLLEQMAAGGCAILQDSPAHRAVCAEAALYFDPQRPQDSLAEIMARIHAAPAEAVATGTKARQRIQTVFNWDTIATQYENFFHHLVKPFSRS
jgi:glycosyltransferase involved in cell wall biosynthesis